MRLLCTTNFWKRLGTSVILGGIFWTVFVQMPPIYFSFVLVIILSCILLFEWQPMVSRMGVPLALLMPWYPILPFYFLIVMNHNVAARPLLFFLFGIVFAFDTGAYLVGNICGKHLLCPSITSKKTWEGVVGGFLFAIIALSILLYEHGVERSWLCVVTTALIICFIALAGDLFESWLKRKACLKDSGVLLPGHGGFLDRFDGIMFVSYFFYFFKDFLILLFGL